MLHVGRKLYSVSFVTFVLLFLVACNTHARNIPPITKKTPKHTAQANNIIKKIKRASNKLHPYLGHQDFYLSGQSWMIPRTDTLYQSSDVYDVCGMYPMVLGLDLGLIEKEQEENIDRVRLWQRKGAAVAHHNRGGIITVSWHMSNPVTDSTAWDCTAGNVVAQILNDTETQKKFLSWLDLGADFMNSLVDSKGRKIPILFRPFHECNMNGFWWSGESCTDRQFIELWKLTFDYFVNKKKMYQLIWVYSPYDIKSEEELGARYPGDEYVDIIGYERYQLDAITKAMGAERFSKGVSDGIDITLRFAKPRNKIVALTETGYTGVKYDKWWTDGLGKAIANKKIAYVHLWRNGYSNSYYFGPCPKSTSCSNFIEFLKKNRVGMLNYKPLIKE